MGEDVDDTFLHSFEVALHSTESVLSYPPHRSTNCDIMHVLYHFLLHVVIAFGGSLIIIIGGSVGSSVTAFSSFPNFVNYPACFKVHITDSGPQFIWSHTPLYSYYDNQGVDDVEGDDDDDYDDDDTAIDSFSGLDSDWSQALSVFGTTGPHPDLDALQVATLVVRSLQFVDHPTESAGLERCYDFLTLDCRACVTARQGARSVERFKEYGTLAPALNPFMGARRVEIGQPPTYTSAVPPMRGAITSFLITVEGSSILSVQHPSGMVKGGVSAPPVTKMVVRLEQQRRPPHQGCWMVREILDVRHAFAGDMGNVHVGG